MKAKIEKRGLLQSVCRKEKTIFIPRIFKTKQKLQHLRLGEIIVKKTQNAHNLQKILLLKDSKICAVTKIFENR